MFQVIVQGAVVFEGPNKKAAETLERKLWKLFDEQQTLISIKMEIREIVK